MYHTSNHKSTNKHQQPYPSPPYTESEFKQSWMRGADAYLNDMGPNPYPPQFMDILNPPLTPLTPTLSETSGFIARGPRNASRGANSYSSSHLPSADTQPWLSSPDLQSSVATIHPFALHQGQHTPYISCSFQQPEDTRYTSSAVSFANLPKSHPSSFVSPSVLQNETVEGYTFEDSSTGAFDEQLHYRHVSPSPVPTEYSALNMKREYEPSESCFDDEEYDNDEDYQPSRRRRAKNVDADGMFACERPGCTMRSKRRSNITSHMKTHLPDRVRLFKCHEDGCKYASLGFERATDLKRHWEATHLKARPFSCRRCCRSFTRRDGLIRHGKGGCKYLERASRRTPDEQLRQPSKRRSTRADLARSRRSSRLTRNSNEYISNEEALRLARQNEDGEVTLKSEEITQGDRTYAQNSFIKQEE